MIRGLVALLSLCACATTSVAATSPEALRGCWIERRGEDTLTMRWFPDTKHPGAWHGDQMFYRNGEEPAHQGYRLEAAGGGAWRLCPLDDGLPHGPPCRDLYFGAGQQTEDNGAEWMSLIAGGERLVFEHWVSGQRYVFFNGARDGCD